jgi:hypothetical protein
MNAEIQEANKFLFYSTKQLGDLLYKARLCDFSVGLYNGFVHSLWVKKIALPDLYANNMYIDYDTLWMSNHSMLLDYDLSETTGRHN